MPLPSFLRLILLAALWGGSFLLMRVAAPVLGALPTTFARVLLGAAGLGLLLLVLRQRPRFGGKLTATLALGVVSSGIPFLMFAFAARILPAGYSAILNATTPLMGVLIGALAFGERITAARVGGVVLGMAGVAVLAQAGPVALTPEVLMGMGACLVATACYGLAGFLTRRWITERGGLDSRTVALGSQMGAVLVLLPFIAWEVFRQPSAPAAWLTAPAQVWGALVALGLLCTALAYVLYFRLIADVGPLKALTVTFLIPLFGVAWGWLLLGEPATAAHAAGGSLIAASLWLVLRPVPAAAPRAR
ncbi:DMT family transporter [Acidovorax sp.]|uniref:DMT family transporter n=1 Tax=Acidovorax sp. TaxID=1872122 RepID=UPI00261B2C9A|nr:DMT family transporter [Acidovorax sp.]